MKRAGASRTGFSRITSQIDVDKSAFLESQMRRRISEAATVKQTALGPASEHLIEECDSFTRVLTSNINEVAKASGIQQLFWQICFT